MNRIYFVSAILLASFLLGCSTSEPPREKQQTPQPALATVDPATAASVSGEILFEGAVPPARKIDMASDPACKGDEMVQIVKAKGGKLGDVFVYVKEGLGGRRFAAPANPVVVDQAGCRYVPHVAGAMVGQLVRFTNSDRTMHNVHPMPDKNEEWNESQQPRGDPIDKRFTSEEFMVPVSCNQHPWMKMYLSVVSHPFFAVTDENGRFELKGLPPGEYTIAAVHEKLGEKTMRVTLGPKENKSGVAMTFGAGQ